MNSYQDIKHHIDKLSVDDRVRLVSEVLRSCGLQVVMGGGNFISADVVLQIQQGSPETVLKVFEALALRVQSDGKDSNTDNQQFSE